MNYNIKGVNADFIIIGAGIVGLTIAMKLTESYPGTKIVIIEKEKEVGMHASGRNSGVLHSGIYYPPGTLKAQFCLSGSKRLLNFCKDNLLPFNQIGKVILTTKDNDDDVLDTLYSRGITNGALVEVINQQQLKELEPLAHTTTGRALFVPETAVVDPKKIVQHLYEKLREKGVVMYLGQKCQAINVFKRFVQVGKENINYKHLVNAAGLYADQIGHLCGVKDKYRMMPFKGLYYEVTPAANLKFNHLIYPVPDMNVPFLGVHFTTSVYGNTYVGPTAIPALGREHYSGYKGLNVKDAASVLYHSFIQYKLNQDGFRHYTHHEVSRIFKTNFLKAAQMLVPSITTSNLIFSKKVGIRAQLLDILQRRLVTDFLIERTANETHILNAVSPAFSSSFSFADYVVDNLQLN